jgi:CRISPR system Cascade subunit CasB
VTTVDEQHTDSTPPRSRRRLGRLGKALDWRLNRLQEEYLRGSASARADLARLRRGLGKPTGSVPEIWELTIAAVPTSLLTDSDGDEPSVPEHAAHAVFTLFAAHLQSMPVAAHVSETSFGTAVRHLTRLEGRSEEAVARRFMAVATAQSIDEVLVHIRGLVTQLRSAKKGFDYARLADDLSDLRTPGRAQRVRLAWGRDFYRTQHSTEPDLADDEPERQTP